MSNNNQSLKKRPWFATLLCVLLISMIPIIFLYVDSLSKKQYSDTWEPNYDDETKLSRTKTRGTMISILLTFGFFKQAIMKSFFYAAETPLLLLYGFFMNSVLGYMGDQGFGKDDGYSLPKIVEKMNGNKMVQFGISLKYVFGSLATYEFWRYIITVFLDMFISMPIQSIIVSVSEGIINDLKYTEPFMWYGFKSILNLIITSYDNILQSFVGFITFLAYTNDTRFAWAYPGNDIDASKLISSGTIKLATCIAGVVYLIANIGADFNIVNGVKINPGTALSDNLDRKLYFVLIVIFLLTAGSMDETKLNDTIVPIFNFMNYEPSRYQITPITNYKTDKFWGIDKLKNRDINKLIDNPKCKFGKFKMCKTDNITGDLQITDRTVDNTANPLKVKPDNIKLIDEYRQLTEVCNSAKLNDGIVDKPNGISEKYTDKGTFIFAMVCSIVFLLSIILILILGYKNYGGLKTRIFYGFMLFIMFGLLGCSTMIAMNKTTKLSCPPKESFSDTNNSVNDEKDIPLTTDEYKKKLVEKFLIDYNKELTRIIINYNRDSVRTQLLLPNKITVSIVDDKYDVSIDSSTSIGNETLTSFFGKLGITVDDTTILKYFNRYTDSCLVVDKDMVSDCEVLKKLIIDDLIESFIEKNIDAINHYLNTTEQIDINEIKTSALHKIFYQIIITDESIKKDINILNEQDALAQILLKQYSTIYDTKSLSSIVNPNTTNDTLLSNTEARESDEDLECENITTTKDKFICLLGKMELRYNKNLGQLVKNIEMGVFMKPLNKIVTKYDVLEQSNLGFTILCFYCFIGYIVPFLPFMYGKGEKQHANWYKVLSMLGGISALLIFFYIISTKAPEIEKIKEKELEIIYKN